MMIGITLISHKYLQCGRVKSTNRGEALLAQALGRNTSSFNGRERENRYIGTKAEK